MNAISYYQRRYRGASSKEAGCRLQGERDIRRRALTIIELTIAIAVFSILLATSMKMIFVVSEHVRANERRNTALQAVQAVSEEIENIPWDQLTAETANKVAIPPALAAHLPGAKLSVTLNDETDPPAKRILAKITWKGRGDRPAGPLRLTTWAFPEKTPPTE